jgi:hypothetical protein
MYMDFIVLHLGGSIAASSEYRKLTSLDRKAKVEKYDGGGGCKKEEVTGVAVVSLPAIFFLQPLHCLKLGR